MKIGFLITARLKSTRLPLKLLMDLNGKTVVERVIERCKKVVDISDIVLCTSSNPQDKPLVDLAKKNSIYYYLGSEVDVLQRLSGAVDFFDLDYIVNITGENPLFSIYHANQVVDQAKREKNDYIYIDGLPIGCSVYGIKKEALKTVCEIKQEIDTEIWGPLLNRPEIFDVQKLDVKHFYNRSELRITTDYLEDFRFINKIYSHFTPHQIPSLLETLTILDNNPDYLTMHQNRKQAKIDESIVQAIEKNFKDNKEKIKKIKKSIYQKLG